MSIAQNSLAGRCEYLVKFGKLRLFAIVVACLNFSCTLLATFGRNSKEVNLEETNHEDGNASVGVHDGFGNCSTGRGTGTDAHTRPASPVVISGLKLERT
jgi:hypothetical protein